VPLAVGAWVNANAFGVLAFRPELKDHPVYRAGVASSFVAASCRLHRPRGGRVEAMAEAAMSGHCTEPVGSIGWTDRTGGALTLREGLSLAGPLVRDELRIAAEFLAMTLRRHPGRRSVVNPAELMPPDSSIAREAEERPGTY